ncbi:MAG: class I SAM-dependent methyltransferase [Patescibacteria group bacterium]
MIQDSMIQDSTMRIPENAMAVKRPICSDLLRHYNLPSQDKLKYLATSAAKFLLDGLPTNVAKMLCEGFLTGTQGVDIPDWKIVVKYFQQNSEIIPALTKNPGTYEMLEMMYRFKPVFGAIDKYFRHSKSGEALYNRYRAVDIRACKDVKKIIEQTGFCLMIDIGSGPGRNGINICQKLPKLNDKIAIECIDIDTDAIAFGQTLVADLGIGINQVIFVQKNMMRLAKHYPGNVDYGLLIGILCGLTRTERVKLLTIIKPYFREGALLVAASLLDRMAEEDLLCAYILRETTGWGLQYPPLGELKKVFEEAGWCYEGYFQEEPTRFYEIGVGLLS